MPGLDDQTPWATYRQSITPAETHRSRVDLSAVNLRNALRAQAEAGVASPADTQLLAAIDRWSAGELV